MKTRRYSEARIFQILKEVEAGYPVADVAIFTNNNYDAIRLLTRYQKRAKL